MAAGASLARRTAIGATWMVAWRMLSRVLGLVSTLVLARLLVPADFGLLGMATTFAFAVEALSQLGLQDALVRHPEGDRLRDTAFTLQLARGVATGLVVVLAAPAAAWWFAEPRLVPVLLVLGATAVVSGAENIGIVEFRREMRFDKQFALMSAPRLLQVVVTIPVAVAIHSYWALLAGIVISKLARTTMTYVVHPYRPRLRLAGWRELAGFSFWTWATSVVGMVWDRCDSVVLGPRLGPTELGIYLLALDLATLPSTELIYPAVDALYAGFAKAQRQGTSSVGLAPMVALALLMGILPLIISFSCGSGYLVAALLGPKWSEAQGLIAILAWMGTFSPFSLVVGTTLVANGLVRRNFIANVATSTIKLATLVLAVSLTRRIEVIAAATAGCVAAESAVFLLLLKSTGRVRLRDMAGGFLRAMFAAAATVFVLHRLGLAWQYVTMPGLPAAGYGMLIGLITVSVYTVMLLAAWHIAGRPDGPEQRLIALILPRLRLLWRRRAVIEGAE
jgi:O-antigen/teichoic acid export membrane protein